MNKNSIPRRHLIRSSVFGLIGITVLSKVKAGDISQVYSNPASGGNLFYRYPAMSDDMVSAVVGAAHTDLEKVKSLVNQRPELANATWDWGFGDVESALGAASHMGRKDIAEFLMSKGARPDLFTMAMLGDHKTVQQMVETIPGIQSIPGPHGITLLQHAKSRLRFTDLPEAEKAGINKTVAYLEGLGNADQKAISLSVSAEDQKKYIGEYRFGEGADEVFVVNLNSRDLLQVSRKGTFGRVLNRIGEHEFAPGGAASVKIRFKIENGKAISFAVHEPDPVVTAIRI